MTDIDVLDLFAGPGGFDVGLRDEGLNVLGIELEENANATAQAAGFERLATDVAKVNPDMLDVTGLVASPPCQGFSQAGLKTGQGDSPKIMAMLDDLVWSSDRLNDERSALVLQPLRYALVLEPKWLIFEQVKAVLPIWEKMAGVLRQRGYNTLVQIIHAEEFGVPQTRQRAYLIAHQDKEINLVPTHSKYNAWHPEKMTHSQKWVSMAEALGWDEQDFIGFPRKDDLGSEGYRERDFRPATKPAFTLTSKARSWERWIKPDEAKNLSWPWNRPSPTIVGSYSPHIVAAPGYRKAGDGPRQNQPGSVKITPEEAAILQTFPADYPWQGSRTKKFEQIGNAVPPKLAREIVRGLL